MMSRSTLFTIRALGTLFLAVGVFNVVRATTLSGTRRFDCSLSAVYLLAGAVTAFIVSVLPIARRA